MWTVPGYATLLYATFFVDFVWTDSLNVPAKFEFVALPVSEIIRGSQKIWAVPAYAHVSFTPKFFLGFCSDGPCECIGQMCSP